LAVQATGGTVSPMFDRMYAQGGRPSIPPERWLKSMLLIALYSVRSERQFCPRCQSSCRLGAAA
jgi:transposase